MRDKPLVSCRKIEEESRFFSFPSFRGNGQRRSVSAYANRYLFTGREYHPATELYYYRARWYSPALGRFLQRDPRLNLEPYVYANDNPVVFIDPQGLLAALKLWHTADQVSYTDKRIFVEGTPNGIVYQRVTETYSLKLRNGARILIKSQYGEVFGLNGVGQFSLRGDIRCFSITKLLGHIARNAFYKNACTLVPEILDPNNNLCEVRSTQYFEMWDSPAIQKGAPPRAGRMVYTDEGFIMYDIRWHIEMVPGETISPGNKRTNPYGGRVKIVVPQRVSDSISSYEMDWFHVIATPVNDWTSVFRTIRSKTIQQLHGGPYMFGGVQGEHPGDWEQSGPY